MKKSHIRDYATEAFRYYAREGSPSYEELKEQIYQESLENAKKEIKEGRSNNISNPTEYACLQAEKAVEAKEAELLDILAVQNTLLICSPEVKKVIEYVYFIDADKVLEKGDICDRVHKAMGDMPAGENTVYRWLRQARNIFAHERGLRL